MSGQPLKMAQRISENSAPGRKRDTDGMQGETRYCTECREPLPAGATWCEACGADAGDLYDGRIRGRGSRRAVWGLALLAVAAMAAVWFWRADVARLFERDPPPAAESIPVRAVRQRPGGTRQSPGATLNEAEAVRALRRHLTSAEGLRLRPECVALISRGTDGPVYLIDAVDSCERVRLGRWRVDGRSGEVGR